MNKKLIFKLVLTISCLAYFSNQQSIIASMEYWYKSEYNPRFSTQVSLYTQYVRPRSNSFQAFMAKQAGYKNIGPDLTHHEYPQTAPEAYCRGLTLDTWYFLGFFFVVNNPSQANPQDIKIESMILSSGDSFSICSGSEIGYFKHLGVNYGEFIPSNSKIWISLDSNDISHRIVYLLRTDVNSIDNLNWSFLREGVICQIKYPFRVWNYNEHTIKLSNSNGWNYKNFMDRLSQNHEIGIPLRNEEIKVRGREMSIGGGLLWSSIPLEFTAYNITDFSNGRKLKLTVKAQIDHTPKFDLMDLIIISSRINSDNDFLFEFSGNFEDSSGLYALTGSETFSGGGNGKYLSILIIWSLGNSQVKDYSDFNIKVTVRWQNDQGSGRWSSKEMSKNYPNCLGRKVPSIIKAECMESDSSDCSITHNFGLNFQTKSIFQGFWDPEDLPSNFFDHSSGTENTKCWLKYGTFFTSPEKVNCGMCHLVTGYDITKKEYISQVTYKPNCLTDFSVLNQASLSKFCQYGEIFNGCFKCKDGYYLDRTATVINKYNCRSIEECKKEEAPYIYSEIDYGGAIGTVKYCDSCGKNCKKCSSERVCLECGDSSLTPSGAENCPDCSVVGCSSCINLRCDSCSSSNIVHVTKDGTFTCETPGAGASANGCNPSYGLDKYYSNRIENSICRACSVVGCSQCFEDFSSCEDCQTDEGYLEWVKHPITPKNNLECLKSDQKIDFFYYETEGKKFDRCLENCKICSNGQTCDECIENFTFEGGICKECQPPKFRTEGKKCAYKCRSPFVYDPSKSEICYDCSQTENKDNYDCSMAIDFNIKESETINQENEIFFEIFSSKIDFEKYSLFPDKINLTVKNEENPKEEVKFRSELIKPKKIKISFEKQKSSFEVEINFLTINSTLEEDYLNMNSSLPLKILKNKTLKFKAKIQGNPSYLTPTETKISQIASTTGRSLSYVSTSIIILSIILNIDVTGMLFKVIQIINLFDKLRMINVEFKSKLGDFLKILAEMFNVAMFEKKNDYFETDISCQSQFFELRVPSVVYRMKLDKLIFAAFSLIFFFLEKLNFKIMKKKIEDMIGREFTQDDEQIQARVKKLEKVEKRYRKFQNLKNSMILTSCLDVFFYCGHQLIHQNRKNIMNKFEYFFSYIFSILIFLISTFTFSSFIRNANTSSFTEIKKKSDFGEKIQKNLSFLELNFKQPKFRIKAQSTLIQVEIEKFVENFINEEISEKSKKKIFKIFKIFNVVYTLRLLALCLPLLVFQSSVYMQISILLLVEVGFSFFLIISQIKFKVFSNNFIFLVRILESIFLVNLFITCFLVEKKFDEEGFYRIYEFFTFFLFILVIIVEYVQLCVIGIIMIKNMLKKIGKGKNKIENLNFEVKLMTHPFLKFEKFIEKAKNENCEENEKKKEDYKKKGKNERRKNKKNRARKPNDQKKLTEKSSKKEKGKKLFRKDGIKGEKEIGSSVDLRKGEFMRRKKFNEKRGERKSKIFIDEEDD